MNAKKLTQKKTLVYFFKNVDQSVAGFYYEMIIGILALVAFINAFKCIDFPEYVFEHPLAFWFNQLVLLIFTFLKRISYCSLLSYLLVLFLELHDLSE